MLARNPDGPSKATVSPQPYNTNATGSPGLCALTTLCFCPVSDNVPEEVKSLYRPRIPKKGEDVWLIIGEFLSHKSSINGVLLNSTSTDEVFLDHLSDILLISVGFLHITEHLYLLLYLYKFLQSYYKKMEGPL